MQWLFWIVALIAVLAVAVSKAWARDQENSSNRRRPGSRRISPSRWML